MSNEKLISASDLTTVIRDDPYIPGRAFARVSDYIDDAPAVDAVEVVHGRFVSLTECANAGVYCSVCNKKVYKEDYAWCNRKNKLRSNYCPNCGAKMDGGNEDG